MLQNHLKIAWRNLWKHKAYSFINISGLTIGLTVCLLIFMWVQDELSYDRFHEKADRMYQSLWEARYGDNEWKITYVPVPLANALEREFPEVEQATRVYPGGLTLQKGEEFLRESNVLFVDEDFFNVFTLQTITGDVTKAATDPNAIVLTEETATRYFGDANPVGKTIEQNDGKIWQVVGVVQAFPEQSHLEFDFISSLNNLSHIEQRKDEWGSASCMTYFTLQPQADPAALNAKLEAFVAKNVADEDFAQGNNFTSFPFQPVTDIHLHFEGNITYVYIFGIVALIILLLAGINFVNLSTARALTRAKEVGVRKTLGSFRSQLIQQFFTETGLYIALAMVGAVLLVQAVLPSFNAFAEKELSLNLANSAVIWVALLAAIGGITVLTGVFPALVLSAFRPVNVLKGKLGTSHKGNWLREGLVVLQFCISIGLIIGTLVINNQLHFLQNQRLGFDKEHVLVINRATALGTNYVPFLQQINGLSGTQAVATSQYLPGDGYDSTIFTPEQPSNYKETSLAYSHVDANFVDALKLTIVEGRSFDPTLATDSSGVIINQTAAERLGWDDPIGKTLTMGGLETGRVIGVVEDFHYYSLHDEIEPIVLLLSPRNQSNIIVRLQPTAIAQNVAAIEAIWKDLAPTTPLDYSFLDDDFQRQYESEQRMAQVFVLFAILAIFIACLGLFGLASHLAAQRTKEIGIRKVLGATTVGIVQLLSRDFLKLVLIALVIAAPLAWYFMHSWLENFAYHTTISWWTFAVAGLAAMLIAGLTVSYQSISAALSNPAESLKSE